MEHQRSRFGCLFLLCLALQATATVYPQSPSSPVKEHVYVGDRVVAVEGNPPSNVGTSSFIFSPDGDGVRDTTTISFTLSGGDYIRVEILDRFGNVIATPFSGFLSAGTNSIVWNGITSVGVSANDGMYTYRVSGDNSAPVYGSFGINRTIPEVSTSWFLAEGSTVGFAAYLLIQNPNTQSTTANITFYKQDGTTVPYSETVGPLTRTTVAIHGVVPNTASVSSRVQATLPVIVERAMYFNSDRGGHDSVGSIAMSTDWYFPGNRTFSGDEDFILIANTSPWYGASVTATFLFDDQAPITQSHWVSPNSRYTIAVHGVVQNRRVSVRLQSSLAVAAERAFYISSRQGGSAGIGAVSPSLSWYFAEGDTSSLTGAATTFLEMMNPGASQANVTVNYMLENGSVIARSYAIAAQRRVSVDVGSQIGTAQRFSMEVLSDNPIVAERLMFSGTDVGDSIGSPTTAYVWNLAEGFTAFGYETWVIVSNPGNETAAVTVRFSQQNGVNVIRNYTLAPKQRLTVYANEIVQPLSFSTQVSADRPVVVERTMKFQSRTGMHQSIGVRQ